MVAPADNDGVRAGHASLAIQFVCGQSAVTSCFATNPLKLLTPHARGPSVWAYTSSFGGGLVAGDQTSLDLRLAAGTCCFLGTQASTKVYRNPAGKPCGHVTRAEVGPGALLVFAPDPVQAFAQASYTQRQEFHLAAGASLVLLDWCLAGRAARGERWAFARFHSRNEIFVAGERLLLDSLLLDPAEGPLDAPHRMGRFNCLATLALVGPSLSAGCAALLNDMAARPVRRRAPLVGSASPIREGALLRIAGERSEEVAREIHQHLRFLAGLLGDDPWARKC